MNGPGSTIFVPEPDPTFRELMNDKAKLQNKITEALSDFMVRYKGVRVIDIDVITEEPGVITGVYLKILV